MKYYLKDNRTGECSPRETSVEVFDDGATLRFVFFAKQSAFYCPYSGYNQDHYMGDVCEVFIGSDDARVNYYEIELSPDGGVFLAKINYIKEQNKITAEKLDENFVQTSVVREKDCYTAEIILPKEKIHTGEGEFYFNAYRIETDGGITEKHLIALNPTLCSKFHRPECFVFIKDYVTRK